MEYLFGSKLQCWRSEHNVSQEKVADILNVSRRTVIAWEQGEKLPRYESIIAVAQLMNVTTDWLLGLSDLTKG